jgi:RNA ligase
LFPHISHIDELRQHVQHKPEIRFMPQPDGTTIVCYLIADNTTFDSPWARECRGITFDADGRLICRPLHKFFNLGENEESLPGKLPWNELSSVMEKVDGSMLTPYLWNGKLRWKTKKSAESDVAKLAEAYAQSRPEIVRFCETTLAAGYTPIFEFTAPEARIVVAYPASQLTLLHVRHMYTGAYVPLHNPEGGLSRQALDIETDYGIRVVPAYSVGDWPQLQHGLETLKNMEGYVIAFGTHMLKVKGEWYRAAHRVVSFIRERDVAAFVVDERLDDIMSVLREVGAELSAVQEVARRVVSHIVSIQQEVESIASGFKGAEPRLIAAELATHPLRGLVLSHHRGQEVDYLTYFRKNHLKQYPLTPLPTRNASVDFDG